jgi:predicted amidohydrolase YtcJ
VHADYVFVNGEIITVNPENELAQAVAIRGNEICAVGTTEEILSLCGSETRLVNLRGNSLLPGFIDSHLHMMLYVTNQLGVDCKIGVKCIDEMATRLAAQATGEDYLHKHSKAVLGRGRFDTTADTTQSATHRNLWQPLAMKSP